MSIGTGGLNVEPAAVASQDKEFMREAIRLARVALKQGDTPVGSIVVRNGRIIGEGIEAVRHEKDLAAHAERKAVEEACRALGSLDLTGCTLYTTVEPCWMCSFIIRSARISRVVTGRAVPHVGGVSSNCPILLVPDIPTWSQPPVVTTGVLEDECKALFDE